jgi:glycosyltransferase involved in cell wall biosynthesis
MSKNIPGDKKLLIVSDTHFWFWEEKWYGHGPTLREIESIAFFFTAINWIVFKKSGKPPKLAKVVESENLKLVPLVSGGGQRFFNKMNLLFLSFWYFFAIAFYQKGKTHVHVRCPSIPGLIYLLAFPFFLRRKNVWIKYAGSWLVPKAFSYRVQKQLIRGFSNFYVTVNGYWEFQRNHIHSYWNPCLIEKDLTNGQERMKKINFNPPWKFCFVGRLEEAKGVNVILNALRNLKDNSQISQVFWIGEGELKSEVNSFASEHKFNFVQIDSLGREDLFEIYKKSNFILLPSLSEGFPKVIGEAAAFGVIPITSNVSSLPQFITHGKNGFILEDLKPDTLGKVLEPSILSRYDLPSFSRSISMEAEKLTYSKFAERLNLEWIQI